MQKFLLAIPALLALTAVAAAEPMPMNEGQLGEVAAGVDGAVPSLSFMSSQNTSTTTSRTDTNSLLSTVEQTLSGISSNTTYATGVNSQGVTANGTAAATVMGTTTAPITFGAP